MNKQVNILQIIDSLALGGAERVSVNYANAISENENYNSYICTTRASGPLINMLNKNVKILNLNKTSFIDLRAIYKLITYIKKNNINILHAHSSTFFIASIVKLFTKTKLVWHIHNGNMKKISNLHIFIMKLFSYNFDYIFTVNNELNEWAQKTFNVNKDNIIYVKNYPDANLKDKEIELPGMDNKRIVSLSNLRYQKDHMTLLKAFKLLFDTGLHDWHLLLVGKDYNDDYSLNLKNFIQENHLESNIHILGVRDDGFNILKECKIGVISSKIEGLPMALLEYGLANLAVVSTDVGECKNVLDNGIYGPVVSIGDTNMLSKALNSLITDNSKRLSYASKFHDHVNRNYSKSVIIKKILEIYKSILND